MGLEQRPARVSAVWDTGATGTAVSARIAQSLGLRPIAKTEARAVNATEIVNVYSIDVMLPNGVGILNVRAIEAQNLGEFDVLLGMDIIGLGDFAITNADNQTWFSFRVPPDIKHIDYTADAEAIRAKRERRITTKKLKRRGFLR